MITFLESNYLNIGSRTGKITESFKLRKEKSEIGTVNAQIEWIPDSAEGNNGKIL